MNYQKNKQLNKITILSISLFSFYVFGAIFPELFWGTHNLSFSSPILGVSILCVCFLTLLFQQKIEIQPLTFDLKTPFSQFIIVLFFSLFFYNLPIAHDYYGDAFYIQQDINIKVDKFDPKVLSEILSPDWLNSKVGLSTFYEIHYTIASFLEISGKEAVRISGSLFGALYIFIWIRFIQLLITNKTWRLILLLIGVTSPLLAVYMGHFETYALSFLAILIWFYATAKFIIQPKKHQLITLPILLLLILQTHITNWMLVPSFIFCYLWRFKDSKIKNILISDYLNWKGILKYCLAPIFIIGSVGYVVIFDAHNGPRYYDKTHFEEVVFLPLFTNEPPPYDRYNLLSFNHIWDYICLTAQWSLSLVLLLILAFTKFRKSIDWNSPLVLLTGTTFIIFYCLYFVLNPLLGIVVDWDLFSTPAISAFAFVATIYSTINTSKLGSRLIVPVFILSLLGTSFWIANSMKETVLEKIEVLGKRNYKTYWIGTSTELFAAFNLRESDKKINDFNNCLNDLKPFAIKERDVEYSSLLVEKAIFESKNNQKQKALHTINEAISYGPMLKKAWFQNAIINFELKNYNEAIIACKRLIKQSNSPLKKAVKMGVHISLAGKDYQNASKFSKLYNSNWKDSKVIQEVETRLSNNDNVHELIHFFESK